MPRRASRKRKEVMRQPFGFRNPTPHPQFSSNTAAQAYIDEMDARALASYQNYLKCKRENELIRKHNAEKSWCQWVIDLFN